MLMNIIVTTEHDAQLKRLSRRAACRCFALNAVSAVVHCQSLEKMCLLLKVVWPSKLIWLVFSIVVLRVSTLQLPTANCSAEFWPAVQKRLENHVDATQQPCDDFYEYACGNWRVPYQLRALRATDTLSTVKAANKRLLMQYFDQAEGQQQLQLLNATHEQRVVNFYRSCLDKRAWRSRTLDEQSIRFYMEELQLYSEWPVLQRTYDERSPNRTFNWEYVSAQMRRYGTQAFLRLLVQQNWQLAQQLIFYIMPPTFELLKAHRQDSTYDEESVFLYQRYIKLLMMDLGVRVRKANQIAQEVVEFEKALLALVDNGSLMVLKQPQTLASLASEFPQLDLHKYFATLMQDFALPPDYDQRILIVADKAYLRKLAPFLEESEPAIIGKYLLVQFLAHFEVNLHEDDSYNKQKEDCLYQVNAFLPAELSQLWLKLQHGNSKAFLHRTQTHLTHIFQNLKVQFEKMLNFTSVFERDALTKSLGLEKLRAMRLLLPNLQRYQEDIDFEIGDNYDLNLIKLSKLKAKQQLAQTLPHILLDNTLNDGENMSGPDSSYGPLDVNAFYRLKKNAIEIPIGLLRIPFYDACLKPAKIYGSFVYILAHELLHGFDYDGLNYDKVGNVANNWGVKSIIKFGVKANCYLGGRYKNAHLTVNENIADTEGLRLALETFLEGELGSEFNEDDLKLFFLSFAQNWCGSTNTRSNALLHAEHKERVNNVLGNFMEFADIFKCRPGARMHPEEKCRIW